MKAVSTGPAKRAIRAKLRRLRQGAQPRVLDLFAGCGGMSLGAQLAGCKVVAGVELDPAAAASHSINFHQGSDAHGQPRDISKTDPVSLVSTLLPEERRRPDCAIDLLIGGPPCQAFARVGRAKLRDIMNHPDAFLHDPRSGLYRDYLRFVEALAPVAVVVENVPDVLNYGGLNIFEIMAGALEKAGYTCVYGLLNAAHYGVPQMRARCFLIGVSRAADATLGLPAPTHFYELPVGYQGTKDVAVRHLRETLFEKSRFVDANTPSKKLPRAVSTRDAIGDLPRIDDHLKGRLKKAPQRLNTPVELTVSADFSEFTEAMRSWPGFESDGYVYDHAIRYLPRDYRIFKRMAPGDQYPQAHELATKMFLERLAEMPRPPRSGTAEYAALYAEYVPPYDPWKFPNKWRKMSADEPARTIMAHIGKDSYSHIHYDSRQCRTISVREAARLQSFPDGFRFSGTMNPAFRQIGNSVPPILSCAVVSSALTALGVSQLELARSAR